MTDHLITRGPFPEGGITAAWMLESGRREEGLAGRVTIPDGIHLTLLGEEGGIKSRTLTAAEAADLYTQLEQHLENIAKPVTPQRTISVDEVEAWSDFKKSDAYRHSRPAPMGSRGWPNVQDTNTGRWYAAEAWEALLAYTGLEPGDVARPDAIPTNRASGAITLREVKGWTREEQLWAIANMEFTEREAGRRRDKVTGRLYDSNAIDYLKK